MLEMISPLAIAFILALAGTPLIKRFAVRVNALDKPGERKVHHSLMPRLGGLAICFAFWSAVLLTQPLTREIYGLLIGGLVICLVGVWDDIRGLRPRMKLLGQALAAGVVIYFGVHVDVITNPFGQTIDLQYYFGDFRYLLTVLWIVGITNAVNLIDGLDGLAAGISAIAAVTLGVVSLVEGAAFVPVAMLAFILAAAVLGFLKYNFHPAKIFMGDTGSLFLGFSLASMAIIGVAKSTTVISLFLPVVIMGIPIMDTLFAIVRRYYNGKPIFSPDKEHLHHRLLALGLSHRKTVLTMYGVSLVLGLTAVLMALVTTAQGMLLMLAAILGVFIAAERVGVLSVENEDGEADSTRRKKAAQNVAK